MHEITKGRALIPKNPRIAVAEGFYDKANWIRDAQVSMGSMGLFKKWFSERKLDNPLSNVWEFDIGKLIVPTVFFDSDLLVDLAKKYDPITGWIKNHAGVNLFKVCLELIRDVFNLNPNHAMHENIDLSDFQARYDAHRTYLKRGPLQEHAAKVGSLPVITTNTPDPLLKRHFNMRAQALYVSLCKILGIDETEQIPGSVVFIMAQTLQFGMSTILDFATFLAGEIYHGLTRIAKGKVEKTFLWIFNADVYMLASGFLLSFQKK